MPQLSQAGELYASQFFSLAIVFALIYFGIGKAMVPRIERTVDDRQARIAGDLDAASGARERLGALEASYQAGLEAARAQAQARLAEARERAQGAASAQVKAADAEDGALIEAALARVAEARGAALGEIAEGAADAAEAIVARLSGISVDRAAVEAEVKAALHHG